MCGIMIKVVVVVEHEKLSSGVAARQNQVPVRHIEYARPPSSTTEVSM